MYYGKRALFTFSAFLALFGGSTLIGGAPSVGAEDTSSSPKVHQMAMASESSTWAEKLKGQTVVENSVEGRAERAAKVELQHQRMMDQMQKEMDHQADNTGTFNEMSTMHQYGAGKGNGLLMSDLEAQPVSNKGGRCPSGAPVKDYDISAINAEITLERLARLLSRCHVRPDRKRGQSSGRRSQEQSGQGGGRPY